MNWSLTIDQGSNQGTPTSVSYYVSRYLSSLDDGLETRNFLFDVSEALDKVWHECLLWNKTEYQVTF